jgi:hypothetical protein
MVDVAVGEQDSFGSAAGVLERGDDAVEIAAGIDDRGAGGLFADQDRAVLLERRDRDDCDLHAGAGQPFSSTMNCTGSAAGSLRECPKHSTPEPRSIICSRRTITSGSLPTVT